MNARLAGLLIVLACVAAPLAGAQDKAGDVTDMQALRARQREMIDQYAWVDQNEKRVRIPVSRAMEEIAKNGIRRWPAPPADAKEEK